MKKETIEQAAEKYAESTPDNDPVRINSFIAGAKFQQERMLETMDAFTEDVMGGCNLRAKEWLETFNK
jgi:hypothetical protein